VAREANPDREHTVVSPVNPDKANKPASLDNTNRRKVAKVRPKQKKTNGTAIVNVALHSCFGGTVLLVNWGPG
jgi:hypothetical protein